MYALLEMFCISSLKKMHSLQSIADSQPTGGVFAKNLELSVAIEV